MEEQYTEGCSEESCAGCSHSGSCESQKQNAGNTAPSKAPANVGSQVKKVIGVISGKGGVGKSLVTASLARMMIEKDIRQEFWMQILQVHPFRRCTECTRWQSETRWECFRAAHRMEQGSCPSTCFWKRRTHRSSGEVL